MPPRAKVKRWKLPVKKVPKTPRFEPRPIEDYEHMSALTRYLFENETSGMTREELREQFHEYDCSGQMEVLAQSNTKKITHCRGCGLIEVYRVSK